MASHQLMEVAVQMILTQIKTNIASALTAVKGDRSAPPADISLAPPQTGSYFYYDHPKVLRPPAIIVIGERMDFRKTEMKSNFVNAKSRINVSVVVDAVGRDKLMLTAWRYQSALHSILDQTELTSAPGATKLKLVIEVVSATFSPQYVDAKEPNDESATFRQEVLLQCDVDHYENAS